MRLIQMVCLLFFLHQGKSQHRYIRRPLKKCIVGDRVEAMWMGIGVYRHATITKINKNIVTVNWEDGSRSCRKMSIDQVKKNGRNCRVNRDCVWENSCSNCEYIQHGRYPRKRLDHLTLPECQLRCLAWNKCTAINYGRNQECILNSDPCIRVNYANQQCFTTNGQFYVWTIKCPHDQGDDWQSTIRFPLSAETTVSFLCDGLYPYETTELQTKVSCQAHFFGNIDKNIAITIVSNDTSEGLLSHTERQFECTMLKGKSINYFIEDVQIIEQHHVLDDCECQRKCEQNFACNVWVTFPENFGSLDESCYLSSNINPSLINDHSRNVGFKTKVNDQEHLRDVNLPRSKSLTLFSKKQNIIYFNVWGVADSESDGTSSYCLYLQGNSFCRSLCVAQFINKNIDYPHIESINPATVPYIGARVTIIGKKFRPGIRVEINGYPVLVESQVSYNSRNERKNTLFINVPNFRDMGEAFYERYVTLTMVNPDGGSVSCPSSSVIEIDRTCPSSQRIYYTDGCYRHGFWGSERDCVPCPNIVTCPGGKRSWAKKGYWKENEKTQKTLRCPSPADRCLGGVNSQCARGYSGYLCTECAIGYYEDTDFCHPCSLIAEWVMVILCAIFFYGSLTYAVVVLGDFSAGKVVVGVTQVQQVIIALCSASVLLPDSARKIINFFKFINFDVTFLRPACMAQQQMTYTETYPLSLVFLAVISSIWASCAIYYQYHMRQTMEECWFRNPSHPRLRRVLTFSFHLAYIELATDTFRMVYCTKSLEDNVLRLVIEPDLICFSSKHIYSFVLACIILVAVIGVPLYYFVVFYRAYSSDQATESNFIKKWKFLFFASEGGNGWSLYIWSDYIVSGAIAAQKAFFPRAHISEYDLLQHYTLAFILFSIHSILLILIWYWRGRQRNNGVIQHLSPVIVSCSQSGFILIGLLLVGSKKLVSILAGVWILTCVLVCFSFGCTTQRKVRTTPINHRSPTNPTPSFSP